MKFSLSLVFFISCTLRLLNAGAPFRGATPLEQSIAEAKAEYYRNYDIPEAHFKFAAILRDAGCLEAAFFNTESLLAALPAKESRPLFERFTQKKLRQLLPPSDTPDNADPANEKRRREMVIKLAKTDPAAAAYLRFAGIPEQWNSHTPATVEQLTARINSASKDKLLISLLEFNILSAAYLYQNKDYESALPCFIRLYFNNPEQRIAVPAPCGFTISRMLQRVTPLRQSCAEVISRHDPVKLILDNMHFYPRTVEAFLRKERNKLSPEKFIKLCLLASDSVDMRLRSFAFSELVKRDLSVLLPLLNSLIHDRDYGRQAVAVAILPFAVPMEKLPETLAKFANSKIAVIRMSTDAVAKIHCRGTAYSSFRKLADQTRRDE